MRMLQTPPSANLFFFLAWMVAQIIEWSLVGVGSFLTAVPLYCIQIIGQVISRYKYTLITSLRYHAFILPCNIPEQLWGLGGIIDYHVGGLQFSQGKNCFSIHNDSSLKKEFHVSTSPFWCVMWAWHTIHAFTYLHSERVKQYKNSVSYGSHFCFNMIGTQLFLSPRVNEAALLLRNRITSGSKKYMCSLGKWYVSVDQDIGCILEINLLLMSSLGLQPFPTWK